jgi:Fe2+ or Zn2+ uptake regulation protein
VIEFQNCVVQEIEKVIARSFNFEIQGHLLEFFGLCQECQGVT